jgi:hypothetical protein
MRGTFSALDPHDLFPTILRPTYDLGPTTRTYPTIFCLDWPAHTAGQNFLSDYLALLFPRIPADPSKTCNFPRFHARTVFFTPPVIIINYNLPPYLGVKKEHLILSLLIPGKKQVKDINVYLAPLIDDRLTKICGKV